MHAKPNTRESKKKKIKGVVVNFCEICNKKIFWGRTSEIFKGWGGKICLGVANKQKDLVDVITKKLGSLGWQNLLAVCVGGGGGECQYFWGGSW